MGPLGPPEPLTPRHDFSQFSSGVPTLNAWLRGKARLNEARGGARTYVTCDGERVAGSYSLAAGSVERWLSSRVGRNMTDPAPVILLGKLAVDAAWHGGGLGSDLLINTLGRSLAAASVVDARTVAGQAIDDRARAFYERFGLRPFSERGVGFSRSLCEPAEGVPAEPEAVAGEGLLR